MSLVRLGVWASLLVGCLKPDLQPCGDLLCPADSVCLPSGTCATRESIDRCVGVPEGGACTTTVFTGSCVMGVCTAPRCGDGVVAGSEQCDGPVSGVDCVDYGFDTGSLTCSELCSLDVVGSCVRFGWERVLSASASIGWVDETRFLLASSDAHQVSLYRGTALIQQRDFPTDYVTSVSGNGSVVAAGLYDEVVRSDGDGPFVNVDLTAALGGLKYVVVADDGSLYIAEFPDNGTRVYHSTAAGLVKILDVPDLATSILWRSGALYLPYADGNVDRYIPGGTWTRILTAPARVTDLMLRPGGGYYIATELDGFEVVGTTLTPFNVGNFAQLVSIGSMLYLGGDDSRVVRRDGSMNESFSGSIFGDLMSDGKDLYLYGNGVYRFTGTQFSLRSGVGQPARDAKLLGDGGVIFSTISDVLTMNDPDWTYITAADPPYAAAGHSATDFYATAGTFLYYWNGAGWATIAPPSTGPDLRDVIWRDQTSTLYAVGLGGEAWARVGTTWTALTGIDPGCDLSELALHGSDVYTVGTCGSQGAIWKLAGTTWTMLHSSSVSLVALWADVDDNLYAAGPSGGVMRIAGTWHDDPRARGVSISATSPTDIWVGGGAEDLIHWDGALWARVRVVGAAAPHVVATPRAVYIAGAASSVLIR